MIHATPPIVPIDSIYLPAVRDDFSLRRTEELSDGLCRLSLDEFDRVISGLVGSSDVDPAIHEARKSMKRLRAILRLIRDEIGDDRYRRENDLLRDTARIIGPVRDAAVLVETVASLRVRFGRHLRRTAFTDLERRLSSEHLQRRRALIRDPEAPRLVVYSLRSARARYHAWPISGDGRPTEQAFRSIHDGLERTYRRGKSEMKAAHRQPTGHNFHQWRKRVKYLRHQVEVLAPTWPELLDGYIASIDQLGDLLGEEHDLAELTRAVAARPDLCSDPDERTLIAALARHRRAELQTASMAVGRRVYAESGAQFTERMSAYWSAWSIGEI